jgi:hypothetical protein
MPRVYLASYATERFEAVRNELNGSAKQFGISDILSYSKSDLDTSDYYQRNKSILDEVCGAGYWAWKPYFILESLEQLTEGDVLFYCDAGSIFEDSPEPLIRLASQQPQGLILFDARPLKNRQFTKRDCFVRTGCDKREFWDANKVIATILVIRKCSFALTFLNEWLHSCQDRAAITDDPNICGKDNLPGYLLHRHDQAILSILAAKHKLETFRNPAFWGNFLKLPQYRVQGEPVVSPFNLVPNIQTYAAKPQANSPYGTIFGVNRQPNLVGKVLMPELVPSQPSLAARFQEIARRTTVKIKTLLAPRT